MKTIVALLILAGTGIYLLLPQNNELGPKEFADALKSDKDNVLLDLRSAADFAGGHLFGANNIDCSLSNFEWRIGALDTKKRIFIYCQDGYQNKEVLTYLKSQGYHSVTALAGGLNKWLNAGYAVTPEELIPPAELTFDSFSKMLDLEHLVIVQFYLPGDSNCQTVSASLDELALVYNQKIKILRIDIDTYKYLATEMGIDLVPTLHFYENGNLNGTIEGVHRKEYIDEDFQLKENSAVNFSSKPKTNVLTSTFLIPGFGENTASYRAD